MRALRSVTLQPIGWFSRSLKVAIDLRDCVMTAFWPAISARSAAADSTFLRSLTASPMPMLSTNFSVRALRTTSSKWLRMRTGPLGAALCWPACFFSPPLSPLSDLPFCGLSGFCAGAPPAAAADASAFAGLAALSGFAALSSLGALPALGFFSSAIDLGSRTLGDPDLLAVRPELEADAGRLAVLGIGDRDVGQVDRQLLGDDAALLLCGLALVALDHVDPAHRGAAFGRAHLDHLAAAALVAAGEHDDLVALLDLGSHHSTSGASEMIFMWFLARSSRGTGPKMRVPTGSICGVMSTAALRSKRMIEPSTRRMSFLTRTTTAFITSPFLTRPRGIASLTETTITSPMVAYLRLEPPSTLMHMTRRAPELSATSRLVCIWIMMLSRSSLVRAYGVHVTFFFFSPWTTVQRLSLEIGRCSSIHTTSPTEYSLFSSWA